MTVYARSDVASVILSAAHGGCGLVHTRPAPGGEPVALWALTCPQCEDHLRHDSLWASTAATIPETPDEVAAREADEKRTSREQQERNIEVMEKIGEMPSALRNIGPDLAQALIAALAPIVAANNARPPVPADPAPTPEPEPQDEVPASPLDFDALSMAELRKLAAEHGAPVRRSRDDMVATLQEHLAR